MLETWRSKIDLGKKEYEHFSSVGHNRPLHVTNTHTQQQHAWKIKAVQESLSTDFFDFCPEYIHLRFGEQLDFFLLTLLLSEQLTSCVQCDDSLLYEGRIKERLA